MDFTELYQAIKSDDQQKIDELIKAIIPILMSYLRTTMRAPTEDAKDCIQETLLQTIEKIREDKIKKPSKLYYYMLTASRNLYIRMRNNPNISLEDNNIDYAVDPEMQLESLLDKEKQRILSHCKEQLSNKDRDFIDFWFKNPDMETSKVANQFKISIANAWTKKHRIIKKLNNCYKMKSNQ